MLTRQEEHWECIYTLRRHFSHRIAICNDLVKQPKLLSELINCGDETGSRWTEDWHYGPLTLMHVLVPYKAHDYTKDTEVIPFG